MKKFYDLLMVEQMDKIEYVPISHVVYCERLRLATKIHFVQPISVLTKTPFNEVIDVINDKSFMRINNEQLINTAFIDKLHQEQQRLTTILKHKLVYSRR